MSQTIRRRRHQPQRTFRNRHDAGRAVAHALDHYRSVADVLVLGLARGGVPVAREVAVALGAPLDVLVVRKLGVPQWAELAMGAMASGGVVVLNEQVIARLAVTDDQLQAVVVRESAELARREAAYRAGRARIDPMAKTVILVDDGIATGASIKAGCQAMRAAGASRIVVAAPVGAPSAGRELAALADEVVCVVQPAAFAAVGQVYADFTQVSDLEVQRMLATDSEA